MREWSKPLTDRQIEYAVPISYSEENPEDQSSLKLSIYRSIYVSTLTHGYQLWVVTERIRYKQWKLVSYVAEL